MNTNIRDAGNFWLARPLAILRQTVAQSIPNAAWTDITMDTEDIDRDGGHSTVTNTARYTSPTAGYLMLSGGVSYAANATGYRGARFALNATQTNYSAVVLMTVTVAATVTDVPARTIIQPVNGTTDYVTVQGVQNSGGALNTAVSAGDQPYMTVLWVSTL